VSGATRCGLVALIGEPNAGKSTLMNRMVGAKVAIVTHKVQTTRARVRGIATEGPAQLVFIDTPGLFRPRRRLDRAMVKAAWAGAGDADVVVLLIEAHRGRTEGVEAILAALDGQVPTEVLATLPDLALVAANGPVDWLRALRVALSRREGAIVPLETALAAERFVVERHLCIDTTAAGGNASLLAASA